MVLFFFSIKENFQTEAPKPPPPRTSILHKHKIPRVALRWLPWSQGQHTRLRQLGSSCKLLLRSVLLGRALPAGTILAQSVPTAELGLFHPSHFCSALEDSPRPCRQARSSLHGNITTDLKGQIFPLDGAQSLLLS